MISLIGDKLTEGYVLFRFTIKHLAIMSCKHCFLLDVKYKAYPRPSVRTEAYFPIWRANALILVMRFPSKSVTTIEKNNFPGVA